MSLKLHIGAGPIRYPGWVNIDIEPSHNPDVVCDCLKLGDLYAPESVNYILSIHHLEHMAYPFGVLNCLIVAHWLLKPSGVLRLVVPDLMKVAKKYVAGEDLKDIYAGKFYYHRDCPAERFMYFCREWKHTILFDARLLTSLLNEAGFSNIKVCEFGKSDTSELRGLDRFQSESLVCEATK